jgi:hypothetical protein
MAEADRWFEPVPATVIQDCSFALQESEIPVEGAIGFKSPGKEQGVGATSESLLSTDYKAYEGFAIALLPSAVPGDLIVGPPSWSFASCASLRRTAGILCASIAALNSV